MIIKVCGMREADNIRQVEAAGATWMGFIFYPRSPRYVEVRPDYLPEKALRVGVFVNAAVEEIEQRTREFGLQLIQLHGKESPEFCKEVQEHLPELRLIKAFSIASAADFERTRDYEAACDYFLFDTACAGYGGSGKSFDWSLLDSYRGSKPFLLSGGITPNHVEALLALHHPQWAGVDLNSGFETAPARKDAESVRTFIQGITRKMK